MALIPWRERGSMDPFRDMERLRSQMNNLFNTSLSRWLDPSEGEDLSKNIWGPALEVKEKKNDLIVKAEIPGMDKEDIEVTLEDGVLTLKGEKKREEKKEEEGRTTSEFYYGTFMRSISLPADVDEEKINASYKNGVLRITLPKKESSKPRQLRIDVKE